MQTSTKFVILNFITSFVVQRSEVDQSPPESQPSLPAGLEVGQPGFSTGLRSGRGPRHPVPRPNLPGMMPGQPPVLPGSNPLGRSNPAIAPMGFMRPPMAMSPPGGHQEGHRWGSGHVLGGNDGSSRGGGEQEERQEERVEQPQGQLEEEENENIEMQEGKMEITVYKCGKI